MSKVVLAIDPGQTTGMASVSDSQPSAYSTWHVTSDEAVLQWIMDNEPNVVVFERFATAGRLSKYGLRTIELVGKIIGVCYALNIKVVRQVPGSRRAFMHDAYMYCNWSFNDSGGYVRGKAGRVVHEADALGHLLCYEFTEVHKYG